MEEIIQDKQVIAKGNNESKADYSDYKPLELNLGVFFSPKCVNDKTSLSFNYTRDYLKFTFTMVTDNGTKEQVFRKFSLSQGTLLTTALRAIVADRLATIQNHHSAGGEGDPIYSELKEENFTIPTRYYKKETNEYVETGKITFSTVPVNGINRVCIRGYSDSGMMVIRVVFYDEADGSNFLMVSDKTILDTGDLDLYRFAMEIERALKSTFIYAGFDKIFQLLKGGNGYNQRKNIQQNEPKKGGFFRLFDNQQRKVTPNESGEDGADLFDNNDDF